MKRMEFFTRLGPSFYLGLFAGRTSVICNEFCPEIGDDVGVFLEDFLETLSIEAKTWRKDI